MDREKLDALAHFVRCVAEYAAAEALGKDQGEYRRMNSAENELYRLLGDSEEE